MQEINFNNVVWKNCLKEAVNIMNNIERFHGLGNIQNGIAYTVINVDEFGIEIHRNTTSNFKLKFNHVNEFVNRLNEFINIHGNNPNPLYLSGLDVRINQASVGSGLAMIVRLLNNRLQFGNNNQGKRSLIVNCSYFKI